MMRFSILLVVFFATLATSSDLMAQSRSPIRDFGRQWGLGWGAGYHAANPGPINHYYSPWSESNVPAYLTFQNSAFDSTVSEGPNKQVPQQTVIQSMEQFPNYAPAKTDWPLMSTFRPIKALGPVVRK